MLCVLLHKVTMVFEDLVGQRNLLERVFARQLSVRGASDIEFTKVGCKIKNSMREIMNSSLKTLLTEQSCPYVQPPSDCLRQEVNLVVLRTSPAPDGPRIAKTIAE
jgi:hypothetical protein